MGAETLIALAALVVAAMAWMRSRARAHPAEAQVPPADDQASRRLLTELKALEQRVGQHEALLCALVTEDEARHLWNIAADEPMTYELHAGVEGELRGLVRRGLVKKRGAFKIHELPQSFDIRQHFELATTGALLLGLRKHLRSTDTKPANSLAPRPPTPSSAGAEAPVPRGL